MVLDLAAESRRRRVEAFFADAADDDTDLAEAAKQCMREQAERPLALPRLTADHDASAVQLLSWPDN